MFGFQRKDEKIYAVLQPLFAVQMSGKGLPPRFWDHPFVLGYFSFFARFLIDDMFGNVKPEEIGDIITKVVQRLSNLNGLAVAERIVQFSSPGQSHPEFEHGADMAAVLAFYMKGKATDETLPYITDTISNLSVGGRKPDKGLVSSELFRITFQQNIDRLFPTHKA
jgi:hypothetical protein